MRTVTWGAACSLDGYIAPRDNAMDWLHFSKDAQTLMSAYWGTVDAVLMGRRTWEAAAASGAGGGDPGGVASYVFSRTVRSVPGATVVSTDAGAFVRELKARPGKGICVMGGSQLASSLLEAGAIDEIACNVHPLLLGGGIPMFREMGRRIALKLVESRPIAGGCVYATYRVVH